MPRKRYAPPRARRNDDSPPSRTTSAFGAGPHTDGHGLSGEVKPSLNNELPINYGPLLQIFGVPPEGARTDLRRFKRLRRQLT